jgi:hypothetical protein
VPSIEVERLIAAEPTSAALILAAPAAAELWPGASLVSSEPGDYTRVSVAELDEPVLVRALPPQRTPTSFVIRFTVAVPGLPGCDGELSLTHATLDDGEPGATLARLVVHVPDGAGPMQTALAAGAPKLLHNLAAAAEGRSRAA